MLIPKLSATLKTRETSFTQHLADISITRTTMRLDAVNEIINQAKAVEFRSRYLQQTLTTQSWQLPELISVDADPAGPQLLNFIIDYIELAPQTLACIAGSAERVGLDDLFQPFLQTAMGYFTRPAIILNFKSGLDGMMIRAYQCHRLIEELYKTTAACATPRSVNWKALRPI